MLLTLEEAKTKWCPQFANAARSVNCIADDCPYWNNIPDHWPQGGKGYCGRGGIPVEAWIRSLEMLLEED